MKRLGVFILLKIGEFLGITLLLTIFAFIGNSIPGKSIEVVWTDGFWDFIVCSGVGLVVVCVAAVALFVVVFFVLSGVVLVIEKNWEWAWKLTNRDH